MVPAVDLPPHPALHAAPSRLAFGLLPREPGMRRGFRLSGIKKAACMPIETVIGVLIALAGGMGVGYWIDRLLRGAAYQRRDEILKQAEREAETHRKSQELAAKEELITRREDLEKELNT